MGETEFVRQVIRENFGSTEDLQDSTDERSDVFSCLTRLQLESVIEQSSPTDDLAYRESLAFRVFQTDKRDAFKQRHKLSLSKPSRTIKRKLTPGHLALLSRSDLISFAKSQ